MSYVPKVRQGDNADSEGSIMTPSSLLADLRASGFSVSRDGKRLLVAPISRLDPRQRAMLKRWKRQVLALLASEEDADARAEAAAERAWLDDPFRGGGCVVERASLMVRIEDDPPRYVALPPGLLDALELWAKTR